MAADHNQKSVLLGEGPVYTADSPEGDYILLLGPEEVPTKEKAEYNRMCLNLLYDTVQEVKTATAGMDACHTAEYIYNWILNNVSYEEETTCRTATRLEKRIADCDGMAGLVYIMAMNCGLDVRTVCLGRGLLRRRMESCRCGRPGIHVSDCRKVRGGLQGRVPFFGIGEFLMNAVEIVFSPTEEPALSEKRISCPFKINMV